ncbi:MAG TPA: hypothetical protein VKV30_03640 [Candidatus Angelobacter sp.]|nr:hypothetical protein [Candidatus Angelobacter sp.]
MNRNQSLPNDDRGDKAPQDINLQDSALRERFVSLREEEQQHIPAFASLWGGRSHVQWNKGLWFAAAGCALIVVIAILLLRSKRPNRDEVSMVSITEWKAPTDFLLETPGREILQTVPEIGKWQGYTAATSAGDRHSQVRKKALH